MAATPTLTHLFSLQAGERFAVPRSLDTGVFAVEEPPPGGAGEPEPPPVFRGPDGRAWAGRKVALLNGGSYFVWCFERESRP